MCASEISLKGTSRTLEPTSDKKTHGQFCSFIRCIGLLLELFFKGLFSRKGLQDRKAASFNKAKVFFAEKLKQQPLIEFWERQVLMDACCELPDGQSVTKARDSPIQMLQPSERPKKLCT